MTTHERAALDRALEGDINAFGSLFAPAGQALKSYLYRLTADCNDTEDLVHDTFIQAFDKLSSFRGEASLKTWIFQIATNLARTRLKGQRRWTADVSSRAKALVGNEPALAQRIQTLAHNSPYGSYEIKEHINTCFTCIGKNLPIENQIAIILREVYDFALTDICTILEKSQGTVKYLLQAGRSTMMDIFEARCALINKEGVCHQCSELNGWFNPKQNQQEALMKINLARGSKKYDREAFFQMRLSLIKAIDPLTTAGNELQDMLLQCNHLAMEGNHFDKSGQSQ